MTRTVSRHAFWIFATALGCGPAVGTTPEGGGDGTEGGQGPDAPGDTDDDGADTDGFGSETGTPEDEPPPPATIRVLYSTENGLMARTAVDGVVGDAELVAEGSWWLVNIGDETIARQNGTALVGPWSSAVLSPRTVECPQTEDCSVYYSGGVLIGSESQVELMGSDYYVFDFDEAGESSPRLVYGAVDGRVQRVVEGGYLAVVAPREAPSELLRVPVDEETSPESLLALGPNDVSWSTPTSLFRGTEDDRGLHVDLKMIDVSADEPTVRDVPLLPGATGHALSTVREAPQGQGLAVVQMLEAPQMAWIPYGQGTLGAAIQLSTGAASGGLSLSANPGGGTFSPDGEWFSFTSRPDPDGPNSSYLVRLADGPSGEPVSLGQGTWGVEFTQDGSFAYFVEADGEASSIARAPLEGGVVGPIEVVFEGPPLGLFSVSEDGSTVAATGLDDDRIWVVDLASEVPVSAEIDGCGDANIFFTLASDGSLLSCAWDDENGGGQRHAILGVRSGERIVLEGAESTRLLTVARP